MITQAELKQRFNYNPETGVFTYLTRPAQRIHVGDVAGANSNGYIQIKINYTLWKAHRLAWLYVYGELPKGEIDHINGMKGDNRIVNLRDVDSVTNSRNMPKYSNNTSGQSGVGWHSRDKVWSAFINGSENRVNLGSFETKQEAIDARRQAEIEYGFHPNHGRNG
jgi:hypothetical protein